jgi:hypothetical protein
VDFLPDLPEEALRGALAASLAQAPAQPVARRLPGALPARLAEALALAAGVPPDRRAGETSRADRHALLLALKRWTPPVAGTRGFACAEVTAGGLALPEVSPATLESRLVRGLFAAGEVLDVDGPIGGFNFQAAFATGHAAGLSV